MLIKYRRLKCENYPEPSKQNEVKIFNQILDPFNPFVPVFRHQSNIQVPPAEESI